MNRRNSRWLTHVLPTQSREVGKVKRWIQTFSTAHSSRSVTYHDGRPGAWNRKDSNHERTWTAERTRA
jgi:hypothetical protein